jgi:cyanate permease
MNSPKISRFRIILSSIFSAIFGISLSLLNDLVVRQKWLGFIAMGIIVIGFIGIFFSPFSAFGFFMRVLIDGIKNLFKK